MNQVNMHERHDGNQPVATRSELSADDLIALNDEIAGMARAGLPLDQGLAALAREMGGGRLQRATAEIAADLQAGRTLPEALDRQQGRVPAFYVGLVGIAVRSGRVAEVLATLTTYARSISDLRSLIISASVYPAAVVLFSFALVAFIAWQIVPQFEAMFIDFGVELPPITMVALEVGRHPLESLVLPPLAVLVTLLVAKLSLRGTTTGRRAWARLIYSVPLIGTLIRSARMAAFADLLSILIEHKMPLPEAFRMAGEASSDPLMAHAARGVQEDLEQGMALGEALRHRRLVPELIAWMTGFGERRGTLSITLHQVAEMYRRQAEMRAHVMRSALPAFLVICTAALVVGFFVLAMFMPLISLISALAG